MNFDPLSLREQLMQLCEPFIENKNFELVNLEVISGNKRFIIRFFLDRLDQVGGITIDDCARMSRELEDMLDGEDVVHFPYVLEVSSPGVDRPLVKEKDFQRFAGNKVIINTHLDESERHRFTGLLRGVENHLVILEMDNEEIRIPFSRIKKAKIKYEWD